MNAQVQAVMAAQHRLITRPQALAAGMSAEQIARLRRSGRWVSIHTGVYAEAAYVATLTTHRGRRLLVDRAVSLRIEEPHVFSHHSAAYLMGLPVLQEPAPTTHITRPGLVGTHHRKAIQHHLAPYDESMVITAGGSRVLGPARTAADIARTHGYLQGLVAADSAYRMGASRAELVAVAAAMRFWPGSATVRDVIVSASPDTDSVGETLARELVTSLGLGVPQVQFGLEADGRTVWCDLRLGRHIIEFHGQVKYRPRSVGGFAAEDPYETLWQEKQRQDFICSFKLGMSHLTWSDHFGRARELARERLLREYLDTCRRFGTDVHDLAEFRPRRPRLRPAVQASAA